ncbi:MAG: hypothetical protein IPG50_18925 [Myxococcales bacterium]|nr:hypothetical protein [Myxococcales bacterium]
MDAALMRLIHEYGGAPPGEPIAGAASRAADFVERAMVVDAARCDEVLTTQIVLADRIDDFVRAIREYRAAPNAVSREMEETIAAAERRFGERLPEGIVELWRFLGEPARARWARGFMNYRLVDPSELLGTGYAADARLACITEVGSVGDTRERFEGDYEEWFADSEPEQQLSSPRGVTSTKAGAMVMLAPELRDSIISFAYSHSLDVFVVHDLRSDAAPSPVFLNHDDDEGFSEYLAPSVREWFAREVTRVIRSMGEEDD